MKTIRLDIGNIDTIRALHIYLAYMLELPAHYGKNLDALHDVLCQESAAMRIVLEGAPASEEIKAYMPRLEYVLQISAQENAHIAFERT